MSIDSPQNETNITLDEEDKRILRILQMDTSLSMDRLGQKVGLSKTATWNRVQRLQTAGVIKRNMALLDAEKAGFPETFFVAVKTSRHDAEWLEEFHAVIMDSAEIMEAHRMAGDTDYLLKVQAPSTKHFDAFYKSLISRIKLFNVTSNLSMETIKYKTDLPL